MTDNRIPTLMNEMWNMRYRVQEYVYGKLPNDFFRLQLEKLNPGKLLLPGEGEGRNAVYAAAMGWNVTAFDSSIEGQNKALRLAEEKNVTIKYFLESYESFDPGEERFDAIGLFFNHMQPELRRAFHKKLLQMLKPQGTIILESFHKNQINRKSGGPKNPDTLFAEEELLDDFELMSQKKLEVTSRNLNEGPFHQGIAEVIQFTGKK